MKKLQYKAKNTSVYKITLYMVDKNLGSGERVVFFWIYEKLCNFIFLALKTFFFESKLNFNFLNN